MCSGRNYYLGQGVGFEIPERWVPIEEDSEETKSILNAHLVHLSEKTLEHLRMKRSVVFLIPKSKPIAPGKLLSTSAYLLQMDIIPTSSDYSRVLQQYFEEFIRQDS